MKTNKKLTFLQISLTLLLLCPNTILGQIWGFQGQPEPLFGQQSTQQHRLKRGQQLQNDCQISQLTAAEPSRRVESEGGVIEIWEPRQQEELKCVGVTVIRSHIENKGLALPHYVNAPILTYVVNGRGLIGVNIPGCPETYESSSSSSSSEQSFSREGRESDRSDVDRHQKVRRIRQGEVIALPAGVSKWVYNDGQERLTLVSLYDTSNFQNQLDDNLKGFFLAGNPQISIGEGQGQGQGRRQETRRHGKGGQDQEQNEGQNVFSGFTVELLVEVFGVDRELIQRLQGQNDKRGPIIRVEKDLSLLVPEWDQEEQGQHQQRGRGGRQGQEERRGGRQGQEGRDWRDGFHPGGRRGQEEDEGQDWRERTHQGGRGGRQGQEEDWRERTHQGGRGGRHQGQQEEGQDWRERTHQGRGQGDRQGQHEGQDWRERTHQGGRGGINQGRDEEGQDWRERTRHHGDRQGRQSQDEGRKWWEREIHGREGRHESREDQDYDRRGMRPHFGGRQGQEEDMGRQGRQHYGSCQGQECSNGVEETFCSLKLKEDIDNPKHADVFNPHGGRLTSLNSHKLPILNFLQLSAEKVKLYKNAILAPQWRVNAHTIAYFTRGEGRIQVVDHQGRLVFDDTVSEGQLLAIPQNYVFVKRAGRQGLEWVSFLTNDNAIISPLAGRISAIRGMPLEVVMNSFDVSREEAKKLKYSRSEFTVFSPSNVTETRGERFAII